MRDPNPMADQNLHSLLSALHLASPALPVGGFAYSQGLEQAIEERLVTDMEQTYVWIRDGLLLNLARQELPWWLQCYDAASRQQWDELRAGNQQLRAMRETAELRLESVQMGYSMAKLFAQWPLAQVLADLKNVTWSYPAAYAALASCSGVEKETALAAYLWSWVENQVLAAMKTVPLGQIEGQELLHRLKKDIEAACLVAQSTRIAEAGSAAFGLALTSTRHETQYTRLFRS
jgi:urease accessory protein